MLFTTHSIKATALMAVVALLMVSSSTTTVSAFTATSLQRRTTATTTTSSNTVLYMSDTVDKIKKQKREVKDIEYGEESRKYRRTVYSHEDWVTHRDPDRFLYYLRAIPASGVYKNMAREILVVTTIACFVCGWNALFGSYQDWSGVSHTGPLKEAFPLIPVLGLPLAPFTLASPSLGLLLGTLL